MDRKAARYDDAAVAFAHDRLNITIELVVDLTHQFLDEVLHRDDALHATVLGDHEGELAALVLQLPECDHGVEGFGQQQGGMGVIADRAMTSHQAEQRDRPFRVVDVVGEHRRPAVAGGDQARQGVADVQVRGQRDDPTAGHQDLAERAVGDLQRTLDDPALLVGVGRLGRDEVPDLLLGDLLTVPVRVTAQQPDREVGGV